MAATRTPASLMSSGRSAAAASSTPTSTVLVGGSSSVVLSTHPVTASAATSAPAAIQYFFNIASPPLQRSSVATAMEAYSSPPARFHQPEAKTRADDRETAQFEQK